MSVWRVVKGRGWGCGGGGEKMSWWMELAVGCGR